MAGCGRASEVTEQLDMPRVLARWWPRTLNVGTPGGPIFMAFFAVRFACAAQDGPDQCTGERSQHAGERKQLARKQAWLEKPQLSAEAALRSTLAEKVAHLVDIVSSLTRGRMLGTRAARSILCPVLHADVNFVCGRCKHCLLYTSPSPRDMRRSRMPSSA